MRSRSYATTSSVLTSGPAQVVGFWFIGAMGSEEETPMYVAIPPKKDLQTSFSRFPSWAFRTGRGSEAQIAHDSKTSPFGMKRAGSLRGDPGTPQKIGDTEVAGEMCVIPRLSTSSP